MRKTLYVGFIVCLVVVVCGRHPLALDWAQGDAVLAHDFTDARAEEERGARHAEVGVEVDSAHALGLALEERAVVGVHERGEQVRKHVLDAARVDLVACDAAEDGCVVELAPDGRRGRLRAFGVQSCAGQMEAAGDVWENREDSRIVREKSVHEGVGDGHHEEREKTKQSALHFAGDGVIWQYRLLYTKKCGGFNC